MNNSVPYQILDSFQYRRMPWKNGLGETLEIFTHEDDEGIRFRISQAAVVEDGVFSDFSGLHRTLVLLSGTGMVLTHTVHEQDTHNRLLNTLDMALFDGGALTTATLLNGPIEDLNIMVRKQDTQSNVKAVQATESVCISCINTSLIQAFYATQSCLLSLDTGRKVQLMDVSANSVVILRKVGMLTIEQGRGVYIDIRDL